MFLREEKMAFLSPKGLTENELFLPDSSAKDHTAYIVYQSTSSIILALTVDEQTIKCVCSDQFTDQRKCAGSTFYAPNCKHPSSCFMTLNYRQTFYMFFAILFYVMMKKMQATENNVFFARENI